MPKVKFLKDGKEIKEVEVAEGTNLRQAALAHEVPIHHDVMEFLNPVVKYLNCHGLGLCGTCHVYIKNGKEHCSPMGSREKLRLAMATFNIGHEDECRLSCQTTIHGDVEVEVQPKMNTSGERFWEIKSPAFSAREA